MPEFLLVGNAGEKNFCQRHTCLVVSKGMQPTIGFLSCSDRLSKIMAQCRKHQPKRIRSLISKRSSPIQYQQGVSPDIAFRMVLRRLRDIDESFQLRKPEIQMIHSVKLCEEDRGQIGFQKCLFQLPEDTLRCKSGKIHGTAHLCCFGSNPETEARGKLCTPQDTERIFSKSGRIHVTQNTIPDILNAAKMINNFASENILHHGIDGKIPAQRRLISPNKRIQRTQKILVSRPGGMFRPRHGNIQLVMPKPENSETLSESSGLSERRKNLCQCVRCNAVDFNIDVFVFTTEKPVADVSADKIGGTARIANTTGQCPGHFQIRHKSNPFLMSPTVPLYHGWRRISITRHVSGQMITARSVPNWNGITGLLCEYDNGAFEAVCHR